MAEMHLYIKDSFTLVTSPYKLTNTINKSSLAFTSLYLHFYLIAPLIMSLFSQVNMFSSCIYAEAGIYYPFFIPLKCKIYKGHSSSCSLDITTASPSFRIEICKGFLGSEVHRKPLRIEDEKRVKCLDKSLNCIFLA